MWKSCVLYESYLEWLTERAVKDQKNIINSFQVLAQNFYKPEFKADNKSLYLSTHASFLIHSLTGRENHSKHTFHLIIIILNFILKIKCSIPVSLNRPIIQAMQVYFQEDTNAIHSPQLVSNTLWLVCKCLQGTHNKRAALVELGNSRLIMQFLEEGQLDLVGEKAICMLLYYISKNQQNKDYIAIKLLEQVEKFQSLDSFKHILATLEDAGLEVYQRHPQAAVLLEKFMVRYMALEEESLSSKMEHIALIAFVALKSPNLAEQLRINEILESKLSTKILNDEPMLAEVIQLIEMQAKSEANLKRYLDLAARSLTNNAVSRRVFIIFHEQMSESQLIGIMSEGLPSSLSLSRIISCSQQLQNGLKLLICLKRSVSRLGLNRIFWYSCKGLIQKILSYRGSPLEHSSAQLFELFEQIMHQQIQLIKYI